MDVDTLICESCQWVEPKSSPVIEQWTHEQCQDFCDLCSAKRKCAVENLARKRSGDD